jgi:phosphoserine phosphatase
MAEKISLTLISNPNSYKLEGTLTAAIEANIAFAGGNILSSRWLVAGEAYDMIITHLTPEKAQSIAQETLRGEKVDIIAQDAASRMKRLLITDMDSTMITCECIDELADFVGKKEEVAAITERAMNGELDFEKALNERVTLLKGLDENTLAAVYRERVHIMGGGRELVATMKANGARCVLVSGGFTFFTSRIRSDLGFDADYSNTLEIENGLLTGRVIPPILDKQVKLQTLMAECMRHLVPLEESLAIGDGANDLPMLLASGLGIAYHAKPSVQAASRAKLNFANLRGALFAQGYREEEIVS